ncbi:hypothetical protein PBI_BIPOLAR_38 [Mycobacterium phage Bipolar]|uniref:hypothetical protein n=1 Tax=Mycobacterium phage Bipolar TaxID=1551711 RepID=UPI00051A9A86|nr:hypothetical protein AVT13_gp038 [Mycobacterium phage Bipolar]AIT13076.1 hypothetical protein PBI_BIPOLAR_38 [Mycobacterium phage Bipolar]
MNLPTLPLRVKSLGPEFSHEADLGLADDDQTPDMRKAPVAAEALQKNHHVVTTTTESEF